MLIESDNPVLVADDLLRRWERGELSWKDQEITSEFLVNAGFTSAFFQQVIKALRARQKIPWTSLMNALGQVNARLTREEIDQILVGAAEEDALSEISRSRALDAQDARFQKIRGTVREERKLKLVQVPAPPAPNPHTVVGDRTRPLIEPAKTRRLSLSEWARRAEEARPEAKEKYEQIAQAMVKQSEREPLSAYDIAISLRFMGLPQEALRALHHSPPRPGALWLELDLLVETERFVEVLDKAKTLERKFSRDPEASFSAGYARAIALHGLGQKDEAKILLEGIVKVRPNYRSAHSLLMKWKAEEK
jgi:hypothetical protein